MNKDQSDNNKSDININTSESADKIKENDGVHLSAFFLGPHAENFEILNKFIQEVLLDYIYWRRNYFPSDPIVFGQDEIRYNSDWYDDLDTRLRNTLNSLKAHYPFHSPRYMAHMLSEQTLPSIIGYFAGMLYNPNNVTDEAAPVTVDIEIEFGRMMCEMLGYNKETSWAHICSGGTLANLEALWVARESQFMPLVIKEFCEKRNIADKFFITIPNKTQEAISNIDIKTLLQLRPSESLGIIKKLLHFMKTENQCDTTTALELINKFIPKSKYSIKHQGLSSVLKEINLKPVIFIPESAHYCFKKAASVLGYGEKCMRKFPVTSNFRRDAEKLKPMLFDLDDDEYVAAVVCVVGTTEEGAVDPVHEVKFLRDNLEQQKNKSFWLHVDSAWGGYIRTLFIDDKYKNININSDLNKSNLDQLTNSYMKIMDAVEYNFTTKKGKKLSWSNPDVIKAFLAIPDADSITVDPHKLGYVPYPAGVIAFKNKKVTQLVAQEAQYISDVSGKFEAEIPQIDAIGSYILEGSKPGAAAMSCWLSAKTIPLNLHNHGKIIKTTLLNAQRFAYYLNTHAKNTFIKAEKDLGHEYLPDHPFKFVLLYNNIDTNVVCFLVVPMKWDDEAMYIGSKKDKTVSRYNQAPNMHDDPCGLDELNRINQAIYEDFTIKNTPNKQKVPPYLQQFFVSRTTLKPSQYSYESIKSALETIHVRPGSYEHEGLFVLRSTIMNPWYYKMYRGKRDLSIDYLYLFIKELHKSARNVLNNNPK